MFALLVQQVPEGNHKGARHASPKQDLLQYLGRVAESQRVGRGDGLSWINTGAMEHRQAPVEDDVEITAFSVHACSKA